MTQELVGREPELALVADFLGRADQGGAALLLDGDAGVGKTTLLDAAAGRAEAAGMRVVRAQGVEFEATNTFSGLSQVLLPLSSGLGELIDGQRQALAVVLGLAEGEPPDPAQVARAALHLVRATAARRPLLLVVDDVHWVDRYSGHALSFVARRLAGSRAGFLGSARSGRPSSFELSGLPRHEVGPLTAEAADALLRHRHPTLDVRARRRLLDEAQGNPLALTELPPAPHNTAGSGVLPLPQRLQDMFAGRVAALGEATRAMLLLAVLAGQADLAVLAPATGGRLLDDLAPAERARLVRVDEESRQVVFAHPLIRAAIVGLSTAAERRTEHRRLAAALADHPDRRCRHLAEATTGPDEEVAGLLEESARRIRFRGDPVEAAALLAQAARLTPDAGKRSARLAESAFIDGAMSWQLGRVPSLLAEARQTPLDPRSALHAAAAEVYLMLNRDGSLDAANRLLTTAIEAYTGPFEATDGAVRAAVTTLLQACTRSARAEVWRPYVEAVARLTPAAPLVSVVMAETFGDPAHAGPEILSRLDQALITLPGNPDPDEVGLLTAGAIYVDRLPACREVLRRLIRGEEDGGAVTQAIAARGTLAVDAFQAGRWDEVDELVRDGTRACELHGHQLFQPNFDYLGGLLAAVRGDHDGVVELTTRLTRWAEPRQAHIVRHWTAHIRMLDAWGHGDLDDAYRHATAVNAPGTFPPYVSTAVWTCLGLVATAVGTGRPAQAQAHARAMRTTGLPAVSSRLHFVTRACEAMTADDPKRGHKLYDEALGMDETGLWPFDVAVVRMAFARRLLDEGARAEAQEQATAASAEFERLRATPWAGQALDLRQSIERAGETGALTPQEYEIAMLAAGGLSNRQIGEKLFLSHRTVSTYLYRIFPKLGITSRAALRDALSLRFESRVTR